MVKVQTCLLCILNDIIVEGIEGNEILDRLGTSLRLEHDQRSKALLGTGDSCESRLVDNKLDSRWSQSIIEGNDCATLTQSCQMREGPLFTILRIDTHEAPHLVFLLDFGHQIQVLDACS